MIYYPAHYLGFEAIFSVLSCALLGIPTSAQNPQPRFDLVARATCALKKGTQLEAHGHHHEIDGLEGLLMPAQSIAKNGQLPFYLADGTTLNRDVSPGQLITAEMLDRKGTPILWTLRAEQDALFFG